MLEEVRQVKQEDVPHLEVLGTIYHMEDDGEAGVVTREKKESKFGVDIKLFESMVTDHLWVNYKFILDKVCAKSYHK